MPRKPRGPDRKKRRMNPRSLDALTPGTTATNQATAARTHGATVRELPLELVEERERQLFEQLAADAPGRDQTGELPRHDRSLVRLLAMASIRLQRCEEFIARHGMFDRGGKVKNVVNLERDFRLECSRYLDALGCSPASRARMGFDLAKTQALAEQPRRSSMLDKRDPVIRDELKRLEALTVFEEQAKYAPEGRAAAVSRVVADASRDAYARLARRVAERKEGRTLDGPLPRLSSGEAPTRGHRGQVRSQRRGWA